MGTLLEKCGQDKLAPRTGTLPQIPRHEKTFRNLALQEVRLRRLFDLDVLLLTDYQAIRVARAESQTQPHPEPALHTAEQRCVAEPVTPLDFAVLAYLESEEANLPFDPAALGFEFSLAEIIAHAEFLLQNLPVEQAA